MKKYIITCVVMSILAIGYVIGGSFLVAVKTPLCAIIGGVLIIDGIATFVVATKRWVTIYRANKELESNEEYI